jgi:hypothetical protein
MLTRKQQWRRVKTRKYESFPKSSTRTRTLIERASSPTDRQLGIFERDGSYSGREITATKSGLSFSHQVRMILVPSRQDYRSSGLHSDLWWEPAEYLHFKTEAKTEVSTVMHRERVGLKTALNMLYQCNHQTNDTHIGPLLVAGSPSPTGVTESTFAIDFIPIHSQISSPGKQPFDLHLVHPLAVLGAL